MLNLCLFFPFNQLSKAEEVAITFVKKEWKWKGMLPQGAGLAQWQSTRFPPHQCDPGSIPGLGVICGLSLLVLYSAPRGFSPGTPVFPSPLKPTFDLI